MKHFVQIRRGMMHGSIQPLIFDYITTALARLHWPTLSYNFTSLFDPSNFRTLFKTLYCSTQLCKSWNWFILPQRTRLLHSLASFIRNQYWAIGISLFLEDDQMISLLLESCKGWLLFFLIDLKRTEESPNKQ